MEGGPARWRKVSDAVAGFLRADGKLAPIYAAEQRDFAFAQFLQVQLVRHRQLGDGRQIECSQAYTHADQNGLRGFASNKMSIVF